MFENRDASCPKCKKLNNATAEPTGELQPRPLDVSVCFYCGALLQFTQLDNPNVYEEINMEMLDSETQNDIKQIKKTIERVKFKLNSVNN